MRDAANSMLVKKVIAPVSESGTSALVGAIIDHQGFDAATYIISTGAIADADATFTVLLEEGDDSGLSDAAAVADADMVSQTAGTAPETAAAFRYDDDNEVRKLGYTGSKRYTRLTITPVNNASAALASAVCVLTGASLRPVTQAAS
jgi:hypothetical protein